MTHSSQDGPAEGWRHYWEERLATYPNLIGTGHRAFTARYNEIMYLVATENMQRVLQMAGLDLKGKRMCDIGPGLGYFVKRYLDWGAAHVTGVDITEYAVQQLRRTFPEQEFLQGDVSDPALSLPGGYDVVSAISVLFHIVEEAKFERAVARLCELARPGGHLLLVDAFYKPLMLNARHANPRPLSRYQPILERHGYRVRAVHAMYHFFNQSLIPGLGPLVLNLPPVTDLMLWGERWMARHRPAQTGYLQYLIAERAA